MKSFIAFSIFSLLLLAVLPAQAQVRHVDGTTGTNTPGCGSSTSPCETIQYAVDNAANDGDTIYIHSGTYSLPGATATTVAVVELPEATSLFFVGDSTGTGAVIDGSSTRRGFHYDHSGTSCPSSMGPHNGVANTTVLLIHNLTFQDCHFDNEVCGSSNQARGGGIFLLADPLDIFTSYISECSFFNCTVDDNSTLNNAGRSASGGAIWVHGRAGTSTNHSDSAAVHISNCRFENNGAVQWDNGSHGGAVLIVNANGGTITNSAFCQNTCEVDNADNGDLMHDRNAGGAICFYDNANQNPLYIVDSCSFFDNSALANGNFTFKSEGGAIFLTRGDVLASTTNATVQIGSSVFFNNVVETGIEHFDNNSGTIDTSTLGFNTIYNTTDVLGPDTTICAGDSFLISLFFPGADFLWQDNSTASDFWVTQGDTIWVEILIGACPIRDTLVVTETQATVSLGPDSTLCPSASYILNVAQGGATYLWQDNSNGPTMDATQAGQYWVTLSINGCSASDTVTITNQTLPTFSLGNDTLLCAGEQVVINAPVITGSTHQWHNGTSVGQFLTSQGGWVWLDLTTNGCTERDSLWIDELDRPFVDLGPNQTLCEGVTTTLNAVQSFAASYQWNTSSSSSSIVVSTAGTYTVTVSNGPCIMTDEVTIDFISTPPFDLGADVIICPGETLVLSPGFTGNYQWQDGSSNTSFDVTTPGTYSVTIDLLPCLISDSIQVAFPPFPNDPLGPDTTLCPEDSMRLHFAVNGFNGTWSNQSSGTSIFAQAPGTYWLEMEWQNCVETDTIHLDTFPTPNFTLGNDTVLCQGEHIWIAPSSVHEPALYRWTDFSTTDSALRINQPGVYHIEVTERCGSATDSIVVTDLNCACDIYIPNAYTPNNDFKNDGFRAYSECDFTAYKLTIFNRWGQRVFSSNQLDATWDGSMKGVESPIGTYMWKLEYTYEIRGAIYEKMEYGSVTIVR